jgi:alanine racemase
MACGPALKYLSIFEYKSKIDPLQRVIAWKSKIMSVKNVKLESLSDMELVSLQKEKMKVASIPIGYSHGYSRSLSNQGRVLIKGQQCIVVGSVNMNMMTVDVTNLESVKKDDEVVLIGSQNDFNINASFSDYSNQLNYELLTRISKTIPRKIID